MSLFRGEWLTRARSSGWCRSPGRDLISDFFSDRTSGDFGLLIRQITPAWSSDTSREPWGITSTSTGRRYRWRFCGVVFSAWLPVPGEPDAALLLHHMSQSHPAELKPFLDQMHTTADITPVIARVFEAVDDLGKETR